AWASPWCWVQWSSFPPSNRTYWDKACRKGFKAAVSVARARQGLQLAAGVAEEGRAGEVGDQGRGRHAGRAVVAGPGHGGGEQAPQDGRHPGQGGQDRDRK